MIRESWFALLSDFRITYGKHFDLHQIHPLDNNTSQQENFPPLHSAQFQSTNMQFLPHNFPKNIFIFDIGPFFQVTLLFFFVGKRPLCFRFSEQQQSVNIRKFSTKCIQNSIPLFFLTYIKFLLPAVNSTHLFYTMCPQNWNILLSIRKNNYCCHHSIRSIRLL